MDTQDLSDIPQTVVESLLGTVETNGDMGACLIAPCLYKNVVEDSACSSLYSLDKIRLNFKVTPSSLDDAYKVIDFWMLPKYLRHSSSRSIGTYRDLWTLTFDESSIAVGLSLIRGSGKTDEGKGFIEYNPNKLGVQGNELVRMLIERVGAKFEVARFDLAIDFPINRDTVRIVKDQRKYGCEISESLTEYLGTRNTPGRVKVYDKRVESKLDYDLTRVELTCDGSWGVAKILSKLPAVFSYADANFDSFKGITKAFAISVQAHMANGDTLEPWLNLCTDDRMKQNLRKAFKAQQALQYNPDCILHVMNEAGSIANGFWELKNEIPARRAN